MTGAVPSGSEVLDLEIDERDSGATSLRDYFKKLLRKLFDEDEGFSGKRPFGSSSWQSGLAAALIGAGVPIGTLNDDGYVEDVDEEAFETLIRECIDLL